MSDPTSNDRNVRVREDAVRKGLLKKREDTQRKALPLEPGEMVDDALARGTAATGKWLKAHFHQIQWVIVAGIVVGAGVYVYGWRTGKSSESASSALMRGVASERGRLSEQAAKDDDSSADPTPIFKTADERREAAVDAYRTVVAKYSGGGPAILGKLGEAGVLLDKRDFPGALAAYDVVRQSPLAKADADVRCRAIEGTAYAEEGKGDIDAALKAFRELENSDVPGFKQLGQYQQARLLVGKGDRDKAKELLKAAREKLHAPGAAEARTFPFLESELDALLTSLDPSAVPAKPSGGRSLGAGSLGPEDIERLQQQLQRQLGKKGGTP